MREIDVKYGGEYTEVYNIDKLNQQMFFLPQHNWDQITGSWKKVGSVRLKYILQKPKANLKCLQITNKCNYMYNSNIIYILII